jgi:predicted ATPase/class 3 adenylate cyclase
MRELPAGTVTFLFTDVEGSTALLRETGANAFAEVLASHQRVLREVFGRRGGVEVDTQGDSFFVAFTSARDAVTAALEAQEALAEVAIPVRMGLHTGEALLTEQRYVGMDVNRAARIAAIAHGGQVLLSRPTRELLDPGVEVRDLGDHRLKDLPAPERLYQLGEREFPPLRTLYQTNMPEPATAFFGREAEVEQLGVLLSAPELRLLTLVGPGGAGKTRLALQAAAMAADVFPDGIWWVSLAQLQDAHLFVSAIANTMDVQERPGEELAETVLQFLIGKRVLFVLDNAEHLLPTLLDELAPLLRIPGPTLLVTSRARLQLSAERVYGVPPMMMDDAAQLFLARSTERGVTLFRTADVEQLCRGLDGLPLALELAAARTTVFTPGQLVERLRERLDLFKGARDVEARQRTLRATIDWSYGLLPEAERQLFAQLAVFIGGCTYEAAEEICDADADTIQSLVDNNMLKSGASESGARYWMLETVRDYALERLAERKDRDHVERRHREHFVALAERAEIELRGPRQTAWLRRLDQEHANIRVALKRAIGSDAEATLRLAAALEKFWDFRGLYSEGRQWLDAALAEEPSGALASRAKATNVAAFLAWRQGDLEHAKEMAHSAIAQCREADDAGLLALSLNTLGNVFAVNGEVDRARMLYSESEVHAETVAAMHTIATTTHNRGAIAMLAEEYAEARVLLAESLELARRVAAPDLVVNALVDLAYVALHEDRHEDASSLFLETLRTNQPLGWKEATVHCLLGLAAAAAAGGDLARSATLFSAANAARDAIGSPWLEQYAKDIADQTEAQLRTSLSADEYADAFDAGAAMDIDEATMFALVTAPPDLRIRGHS